MRFFLLAVAALAATPLVSRLISASADSRSYELTNENQRRQSRVFSFGAIKDILLCAYQGVGEHGLSLLAAGVAFYALFAIFPALAAATWIFGLLANPATIHNQLNNLHDVLPAEAGQIFDQQLNTLTAKSSSFSLTGIVSLLIALYSARTAALSMMQALNIVYGVREMRSFIKTNMLAILFTLVSIVVLLIAAGVLVVVPIILDYFGLNSVSAVVLRYARWPALAVLMALALAVLYRYGPNRDNAKWKWLTWGSGTATVIWLIASFGFSWYVQAFNSYDKVYGSIGAVVVLLFWLWITAFSGLLGAELDNAIERKAGDPAANPGSPKAV